MGKIRLIMLVLLLPGVITLHSQEARVRIVRDSLGIPHIFGKTDADDTR